MPSADQVPVNNTHLIAMRWHKWVVLIAGSTGTALRAVRPPNLHITPGAPARSRSPRKSDGFFVAFAPGHHSPGHPRNFVRKCDGSDLYRLPRQQRREPGPMLGAMDLGVPFPDVRGTPLVRTVAIPKKATYAATEIFSPPNPQSDGVLEGPIRTRKS